jgi:WD40 repeat protein
MQSKKIVRPLVCVFAFSMLLAACVGAPAQPTPATAVPATLIPTLTTTEMPAAAPEELSIDEFMERQNPVGQLRWSADGTTLVASAGSGVYSLDTQRNTPARPFENAQDFNFPPVLDRQGRRLLSGNRVWDVASGKLLYQIASTNVNSAAFSPDGKTFAVGEDNSLTIWDAATGKLQKSIGVGLGPTTVFFGLAFNANGSRLYVNYADGQVRSVELLSGKFVELFSVPARQCCNTFSPDARNMLVDFSNHGEGHKELWDVESGKMLINAEHCDSDVEFSAFSTDGKYFVTGPCGLDAQLWDIQSRILLHAFPSSTLASIHPEWRSAAFSPDGSQLALGNDIGEVLVWDLADYRLLRTLNIPTPNP